MKRETPMGPIETDGSHENMYRLFKHGNPRGSVAQFEEWFKELGHLQDSVHECPWCHKQPALIVIPMDKGLRFTVECERAMCPVGPGLNLATIPTARDAVEIWNRPFVQPIIVKIDREDLEGLLLPGKIQESTDGLSSRSDSNDGEP